MNSENSKIYDIRYCQVIEIVHLNCVSGTHVWQCDILGEIYCLPYFPTKGNPSFVFFLFQYFGSAAVYP